MKAIEVAKLLGVTENQIKKSKGQFKYICSYFYGFTSNADKLIARVKEKIPNSIITGSGNHWHQFVGGAKSGSAKDSYLWVTFTIN